MLHFAVSDDLEARGIRPDSLADHITAVGMTPAHVGAVVGKGAQNLAVHYGPPSDPDSRLVKVPLARVAGFRDRIVGRLFGQSYETACRELEICEGHFREFMVPTEIRKEQGGDRFVILQDKIDGMEDLTPLTAGRDAVRKQLVDIMRRNNEMIRKDGKWLDAMGWNPAKLLALFSKGQPYLDNIGHVPSTDRLHLFDYGLFPYGILYAMQIAMQRANMRKMFGKRQPRMPLYAPS